MIKCTTCGHDNPLGRVHCIQCGSKIDLSKIVPPDQASGAEGEVVVKAFAKKPEGVSLMRQIWRIVDLVILAGLVIAVLLMCQELPVPEVPTDGGQALSTKSKVDVLAAAQKAQTPQTAEFTESEINAYLNNDKSPRHFEYTADDPKAVFLCRVVKYQIELGEKNEFTLYGVAEIRVKSFTKQFMVRVVGSLEEGAASRQAKLETGYIGKLPLHALPAGEKILNAFTDWFFRFQDAYDTELGLLKKASNVSITSDKIIVSVGGAAAVVPATK